MEKKFQFSAAGRRTLELFIAAVIGDAVPGDQKPTPAAVVKEVEKFASRLPLLYRGGFALVLRVLEMGSMVTGFRRPFSRLTPGERLAYLNGLEQSEQYLRRALILLLKSPVLLVYFSDPAMEAMIGYDHACLLKARPHPAHRSA